MGSSVSVDSDINRRYNVAPNGYGLYFSDVQTSSIAYCRLGSYIVIYYEDPARRTDQNRPWDLQFRLIQISIGATMLHRMGTDCIFRMFKRVQLPIVALAMVLLSIMKILQEERIKTNHGIFSFG
jgi:hypothetical protein